MIRYSEQNIDNDDIELVKLSLSSPFLTQGPEIEQFENAVSELCFCNAAIAVSSATAGLHLAYLAVGLKPGDIVWTVGNTFVATASAAKYCGAEVEFIDINLETYNICEHALEKKLLAAERLPSVLCVVHFAGRPAPMRRISEICKKYSIKVIEDASHALGAKFENNAVGSCSYSEAVIFSFHPVKIITTAEGGMICTNNEELAQRLRSLRSHGIVRDGSVPWYPKQAEIGYNYRMTEPQAALGRSQLGKLQQFFDHRTDLANYYDEALKDLSVKTPLKDDDVYISSKHLYVILLNGRSEMDRNNFITFLHKQEIGANLHYYPVYKFDNFCEDSCHFPNNEQYFRTAVTIPLSTKLTHENQKYIIEKIKVYLGE
jgi:UDP-4-amino-4,6-dideoxy-N-acetyl-beta-L-altrosamine transaminase